MTGHPGCGLLGKGKWLSQFAGEAVTKAGIQLFEYFYCAKDASAHCDAEFEVLTLQCLNSEIEM